MYDIGIRQTWLNTELAPPGTSALAIFGAGGA